MTLNPKPLALFIENDKNTGAALKNDCTPNRWEGVICTDLVEAKQFCETLAQRGRQIDIILVDRGVVIESPYSAAKVLTMFRPFSHNIGLITGWRLSDVELKYAADKLRVPAWNKNDWSGAEKGFFSMIEATLKWHEGHRTLDPEVDAGRLK